MRQGYTFTGWYTTPDLDTRFDADLTVHAGWQPTSVPRAARHPGMELPGCKLIGDLVQAVG